jgi:hypothetical protein
MTAATATISTAAIKTRVSIKTGVDVITRVVIITTVVIVVIIPTVATSGEGEADARRYSQARDSDVKPERRRDGYTADH